MVLRSIRGLTSGRSLDSATASTTALTTVCVAKLGPLDIRSEALRLLGCGKHDGASGTSTGEEGGGMGRAAVVPHTPGCMLYTSYARPVATRRTVLCDISLSARLESDW